MYLVAILSIDNRLTMQQQSQQSYNPEYNFYAQHAQHMAWYHQQQQAAFYANQTNSPQLPVRFSRSCLVPCSLCSSQVY